MTQGTRMAAVAVAVALAAGGGYWLGAERGQGAAQVAGGQPDGAKKARKLLYYRNPMGLPDTSPTPKKDAMGMDYVPVYEGEEDAGAPSAPGQIAISAEKVQKLGVRTEEAKLASLDRIVRAAGRVEVDERRTFAVSPKFEGWVERLHVNATGQPVGRGQPLFEVYSPELVSAQREYAIAAQGVASLGNAGGEAQAGMRQLAESSLARLRNWDISDEQIRSLARSGEARRTLTFRSPVSGVVMEKKALQGMRFMPGEVLYQIADLSSVWVLADVAEQDVALVKPGGRAKLRLDAYPDKVFEGRVDYVYPTLKPETRTVQVRLALANPGGMLKPAMYAQVELPAGGAAKVVTVPDSAVIDSGTRQVVLVQVGEGRFEPREVRLGARSESAVEVREGVKAGERVVVAANFLIDSESNLKAALGSLAQKPAGAAPTAPSAAEPQAAKPAGVVHRAEGTLDAIDLKAGTVTLTHGPIASLKWPGMTMDFALANPSLVTGVKPGSPVAVEIVERKPGEWVITRLDAKGAPAHQHTGH